MPSLLDQSTLEQPNDTSRSKRFGLHKVPSVKGRIVSKVLANFPRSSSAQANITSSSSIVPRNTSNTYRKPSLDQPLVVATPIIPQIPTKPRLVSTPSSAQECNMSINVTVTPEYDRLDIDAERTIWVAIEVSADATSAQRERSCSELQIALVLDNSVYTSPDAFENAREIAMSIIRLLSEPLDRVMILCTCGDNGGVTYALQQPNNLMEIVELLEQMPSFTPDSPPQDARATLNTVFSALLGDSKHASRDNSDKSHVIWITNKPSFLSDALTHIKAPLPIHVVEAGVVPWRDNQGHKDGWMISASCLEHETSWWSSLMFLVRHARSRHSLERILNLHIDYKTTSDICQIEGALGAQSYEVLSPGQTVRFLVKVHVGAWKPFEFTSGLNEMEANFSALEGMLGMVETEALRVTVTYNHSSTLSTSNLTFVDSCVIMRPNQNSDWGRLSVLSKIFNKETDDRDNVFKQSMLCLAERVSPRLAPHILNSMIPSITLSTEVKACLELGCAEWGYQAKVNQALGIDSREHDRSHTPNCLRYGTSGALPPSKQLPPIPGIPQASTPSPLSVGSVSTVIRSESDTIEDLARKIWKRMRRDSQPQELQTSDAAMSLEKIAMADERLAKIRAQALQSKRSIGAHTLRSISLGAVSERERIWEDWRGR